MSYTKELIADMLAVYVVIVVTLLTVAGAVLVANEIGLTDIQCTLSEAQ